MRKKALEIWPPKKSKEYKILWYYQQLDKSPTSTLFTFMAHALDNGSWHFVDLNETKDGILHAFLYLKILMKYQKLQIPAKGTLSYTQEEFILDGHPFQTLKEVEKALKLKAFL